MDFTDFQDAWRNTLAIPIVDDMFCRAFFGTGAKTAEALPMRTREERVAAAAKMLQDSR